MKLVSRIFSLLLITGLAAFFAGCGGDDDPKKSDQDVQLGLLNGTWNASVVEFQGSAPAINHDDFVLTIVAKAGEDAMTYTTDRPSGPSAWPGSGTFTFGSNVKTMLIRGGDNIAISYTVDNNSLIMDFEFTGDAYDAGRTSSVTGDWHFEFTKQTN
jgi:hypothetical protein